MYTFRTPKKIRTSIKNAHKPTQQGICSRVQITRTLSASDRWSHFNAIWDSFLHTCFRRCRKRYACIICMWLLCRTLTRFQGISEIQTLLSLHVNEPLGIQVRSCKNTQLDVTKSMLWWWGFVPNYGTKLSNTEMLHVAAFLFWGNPVWNHLKRKILCRNRGISLLFVLSPALSRSTERKEVSPCKYH